jgi:DEAD/DEAH box helicase domain-containing protein
MIHAVVRLNLPNGQTKGENTTMAFPEFALARQPDLEAVLSHFRALMQTDDSPIRAIRHQPARAADYVSIPESVHPKLRGALIRRNIPQLYTHQAETYELARSGRNVVVVTPTASGKTLCYNLPVLDLLLREPEARAMYLFPTKALAEDQLHEFRTAAEEIGGDLRAFTYDGDTPQDARKAIRQRASVVMTNPDMLHSGILPHHTKWAKLFENLRYIVIDELHYYRGVYGSHVANLLRRLRRICDFYQAKPIFICSSATIANPRELARALTESPFDMVDRNGAPAGEKYFLFYNPPVVNRQLGIRRSYINETRRIALEFIERDQQTLVFANNRLATELLVTYLKDACDRGPLPPETVRGYRGGYLPKERRQIERKLRDGEIRAVVATNALELGIDIGSLDAVVMAGYPGTIASTWQRAGRAGRRQTTSAAVLVASSAPLDQYIVEHPDYFFERPPESAHINPDNLEILLGHLKCAAFELPIVDAEKFGPHETAPLCQFLEEGSFLRHSAGAWHWTSETYPADATGLRSITSDNFVVVDITSEPNVIAEVSFPTALTTLHEKAIYLHEARQYHVERFDYKERKAYVRSVICDYFTDAIDYTQIQTLQEFESAELRFTALRGHGEVRVNRQIVGFKKIKFYTLENVGAGKLSMPEQEMHTTAFWLNFPPEFLMRLEGLSPTDRQDGIVGLGAALRAIGSLLLMCDPRDIGVATGDGPTLYLYDNYSGGIGLSAPLYQMAGKLLEHAARLLDTCPCESGCPSCVGPIGDVGEKGKLAARRILAELLSAPDAPVEPARLPRS